MSAAVVAAYGPRVGILWLSARKQLLLSRCARAKEMTKSWRRG